MRFWGGQMVARGEEMEERGREEREVDRRLREKVSLERERKMEMNPFLKRLNIYTLFVWCWMRTT